MKRIIALLLSLYCSQSLFAQFTYSVDVLGDVNKYYPVVFTDGAWNNNVPTVVQIGRSLVHREGGGQSNLGSLISTFKFHAAAYGHESSFIDADIHQFNTSLYNYPMIGGWVDPTYNNTAFQVVIWLRGNTIYYVNSNYATNPTIYLNGYTSPAGNLYPVKTTPDGYVNKQGTSVQETGFFNGTGVNYFRGTVGIGTSKTGDYRLAVDGTIGARKLKVTQETWADYVFDKGYQLPALQEVQHYIDQHKHLPGVPSAADVKRDGVDVGEMNKILLKKIEELTLYLLEDHALIMQLKEQVAELSK
jgi:hypothetical protein